MNGDEGRIRTFEGGANGFTVRPLWPLGNLALTIIFQKISRVTILLLFELNFNYKLIIKKINNHYNFYSNKSIKKQLRFYFSNFDRKCIKFSTFSYTLKYHSPQQHSLSNRCQLLTSLVIYQKYHDRDQSHRKYQTSSRPYKHRPNDLANNK